MSPLLGVDLGEDNQPPVDSPVACEAPRRASRLERGAILSSEERAPLELTGRGPAERAAIRSRARRVNNSVERTSDQLPRVVPEYPSAGGAHSTAKAGCVEQTDTVIGDSQQ